MAIERNTRQRDAIRAAIVAAKRPLSPQEILDAASDEVPGLGIATVYRAIKTLTEEKELATVEVPGAQARYEVAHLDHHHHFHCRTCDRVFEVEGCPGDLRRMTPRGFRTDHHEIILTGLCAGCVKAKK